MEIDVRDKRLVCIWLTNAEINDPKIRESLMDIYAEYNKKRYLVAVYESGVKGLYHGTLDLLAYNRRRCAEIDVERERKNRTAGTKT